MILLNAFFENPWIVHDVNTSGIEKLKPKRPFKTATRKGLRINSVKAAQHTY